MEHRRHDWDATPIEWEPIAGGYTRARKWRVRLDDGTYAFAKEAPATELAVYESVRGSFLPRVLEIRDRVCCSKTSRTRTGHRRIPPTFGRSSWHSTASRRLEPASRWQAIAEEPRPLLALDLCSADWLDRALPALIEAEARVPQTGSGLVHYDVWARNLCFADRGVVLVDWAMAHIGNPRIDLAFALLSLRVEGAPTPPVDDESSLAAYVTGAVATEVAKPPPDWAAPGTTIREDQQADLVVALPWVAQQLGRPLGERKRR